MENSEFVNSGKAFMVALIFFTILSFLFGGCGVAPSDSQYLTINKITKRETCCQYYTTQGWEFSADCGKFNIGDTVYVNYIKVFQPNTLN